MTLIAVQFFQKIYEQSFLQNRVKNYNFGVIFKNCSIRTFSVFLISKRLELLGLSTYLILLLTVGTIKNSAESCSIYLSEIIFLFDKFVNTHIKILEL